MLIDASHRRWFGASLGAALIAGIAYVSYARGALNGPSGGSWPGLAYGVAGTGLLVYAALLGARKRVPTWRIGRAQTWLKGHIWLGLLSFVLILLHGRFALGGPLTSVMMILFGLIVASGVVGLLLQQMLPRLMTSQVPLETIFEQIDHVVAQLCAEADHVIAIACGEAARERKRQPDPPLEGSEQLKQLYHRDVRPLLDAPRATVTAGRREAMFAQLRTLLPEPLHASLGELEAICEERRQLEVQRRLHQWLHGWLFVHVPLSMALLVLTMAHAVIALRY